MTVALVLEIAFRDPALLRLALTHSSYVNERPDEAPESNERLEYLGDAVLGLAIARELYDRYPEYAEGQLT
ncbi:MAG: ribonuclease III, partial [Chloroflexi bacterium]|nr:ribonuclease III [Chloroflexota bacterium]